MASTTREGEEDAWDANDKVAEVGKKNKEVVERIRRDVQSIEMLFKEGRVEKLKKRIDVLVGNVSALVECTSTGLEEMRVIVEEHCVTHMRDLRFSIRDRKEREELEEKIDELSEKNRSQEEEIARLRDEMSGSQKALEESATCSTEAELAVAALKEKLAAENERIEVYEAQLRALQETAPPQATPTTGVSDFTKSQAWNQLIEKVNTIGRMVYKVSNGVIARPAHPGPKGPKEDPLPQAHEGLTAVLTAPYGKEMNPKDFAEELCQNKALVPVEGNVTAQACSVKGWYRAGPSIYVQQVKRVLFVHAPNTEVYKELLRYYQARSIASEEIRPGKGKIRVTLKVRPWGIMSGEEYRQQTQKEKAPAAPASA